MDHITWCGAGVTSVARTVVDVARADGTAAGLVVADAALGERLVKLCELRAAVASASGRPGVPFAQHVADLASPLAESPLESITRLCLVDGGIPVEPQVWVGRYRVDLWVVGSRVIVEADGAVKYRDPSPDNRGQGNPLVREKRRQEALERAGYVVVRVSWADARHDPVETVARVRRALARTASLGIVQPISGANSGSVMPTRLPTGPAASGSW